MAGKELRSHGRPAQSGADVIVPFLRRAGRKGIETTGPLPPDSRNRPASHSAWQEMAMGPVTPTGRFGRLATGLAIRWLRRFVPLALDFAGSVSGDMR